MKKNMAGYKEELYNRWWHGFVTKQWLEINSEENVEKAL